MAKKPTYEEPRQRIKELESDTLEPKQAEERMKQQSEFLNLVLDSLPHPFYVIDAFDYTIKVANSATHTGPLSSDTTCYVLTHNSDRPCALEGHPCPLEIVKKTRESVAVEHLHYDKDGKLRNVEVHAHPIFDSDGNVTQVIEYCVDITERRRAEESLRRYTRDLSERVKELNCLYGISELVGKPDISLEEVIQGTVDLIPPAWRYPEITCARVSLGGQEFKTDNFSQAAWKHTSDIIVHGETAGRIEVCYLEEKPEIEKGLFLKEERSLINAIAERLGRIIERKRAEAMLQESYHELERRVKERTAELTEANEQLRHEMEERKRVEEDLRKDRSSLAEAQRIAHLGNWDWNIITNELKWSDEIYRIFGLAPQEFGATYEAFLNCVHPDDREFVMKAVDEALSGDKPYSIDHRIVLPDGTERIVHEEAAITLDGHGEPIRMIGTVHDITDRKLAEEALQKSEIHLRHLSSRLIEVQESERKRIALELHDSIGQLVVAIKLGLENSISRLPENTAMESVELLKALIPLMQGLGDEVRRIHTDLRPGLLDDLGIIATLSWFCREFERLHLGLRIEKQIDVEESEVPEPLKIVIFRLVQEALNNVSKHAKADLVRLSIHKTGSKIELVIEDNGQGFDVEHTRPADEAIGGVGLGSMKERSTLSGGSFSIDSIKGEGTTVRASWPKKQ